MEGRKRKTELRLGYGASLIGNLMLTWFARNAAESVERRAITLALCVYDAIGFVVTLIAQLSNVLGPLGWGAAVGEPVKPSAYALPPSPCVASLNGVKGSPNARGVNGPQAR